jgi:adenosylcobinamide-phosphate synthase
MARNLFPEAVSLFNSLILALALAADALIGDPPAWPHLVRLMGRAVERLEASLRAALPDSLGLAGLLLVILVVGSSALVAWALLVIAQDIWQPLAWFLALALSWQCLAAGQLWREARAVARPLEAGDLVLARQRLAMIVGRETASLDEAGVRRALIETMAENLNDGVIAPLFYLTLFGPVGAVAYKAINTLDSMVGYKNERFAELGRCAARLDDAAGWLPARLSAWLLVAAARLVGLDAAGARRAIERDHAAHTSPNAGWPEAACAGALGIRLGGPSIYGGQLKEKPWLNKEGRQPASFDVAAASRLLVMTCGLAGLASLAGAALIWGIA